MLFNIFAVYLLGRQFDIVADHGALKYLTTIKHGGPRLSRWPCHCNLSTIKYNIGQASHTAMQMACLGRDG
jgi:hypothetical protein